MVARNGMARKRGQSIANHASLGHVLVRVLAGHLRANREQKADMGAAGDSHNAESDGDIWPNSRRSCFTMSRWESPQFSFYQFARQVESKGGA